MRKVMIDLIPNMLVRKLQRPIYEFVERMEGRELLKLDFERRTKLAIADLIMKPGRDLEEIKWPKGVEVLNVLNVDGSRYTILLRAIPPGRKIAGLFKFFDLNVVYDMPFSATEEHVRFSAIGDNGSLKKLVKAAGLLGTVEKVSYMKPVFTEHDLLRVLTDKQREILIRARNEGYYDYPRKINTKELSEKLGISKATTVEHLRKAEHRLMSNLLEGY